METISIRQAADQTLRENYESCIDAETTTFREYVEMCADQDPNFFRWLFNEDFNNDFSSFVTDEHIELYNDFIKSLSN